MFQHFSSNSRVSWHPKNLFLARLASSLPPQKVSIISVEKCVQAKYFCQVCQFGTHIALYVKYSKRRLYISSRGHFKQLWKYVSPKKWQKLALFKFSHVTDFQCIQLLELACPSVCQFVTKFQLLLLLLLVTKNLFKFSKKLIFWISGFLYFFGFLAIYRQQRELPEIRRCRAFTISAWVTWPERLKGAKDEVKQTWRS